MGNSMRTSRRSFMGDGARRSAELAVELAGLAAGLKPVAQLAAMATLVPEAAAVLTCTPEHVELLDRRDATGRSRVTARSTSEVLRRAADGSIAEGPAIAIALAWSLGLSWERAHAQGQPPGPSIDYAASAIRSTILSQPSVDMMLERMTGLAAGLAAGGGASAGSRLAAEADRFASDVATRHRSAAEQAARRLIASTTAGRDLLLIGDGSRHHCGGTATTTAAVAALAAADGLGQVWVSRDEEDPAAAAWTVADLAGAGIAATTVESADAAALMDARPSLQVLLATVARSNDGQVRASKSTTVVLTRYAPRVLAVVSAFGDAAPITDATPSDRRAPVESVVG